MGVPLHAVTKALDAFAPPDRAETWDRPGLQVGDPSMLVEGVLVALDPSPAAVSQARHRRAQLLLTHHPLLLTPLTRLDLSTGTGQLVGQLVKEGIALFACHTNLDRMEGGVNDFLARSLGLTDVESLQTVEGGRIGRLSRPQPLEDLATEVGRRLCAPGVRFVGDPTVLIERVAVIGGSGASFWRDACDAGAQVLVTADVKYHTALDALQSGFCLVDAGHASTERAAVEALVGFLRRWSESSGRELRIEEFVEEEPFHWKLSRTGEKTELTAEARTG